MSVAFHCENIEMEEIDDETYDVGPTPVYDYPDPPSQEQREILQAALVAQLSSLAMRVNVTERHNAVPSVSSERKCGSMLLPFAAVGLLGLLLLAGITVGVHLLVKVNGSDTLEMRLNLTESHNADSELKNLIEQLQTSFNQLQTSHNNLTAERVQLQTSFDQLQTSHDDLIAEKDQLQTSFDQLQTSFDQLQMTSCRCNTTVLKRRLCESYGMTFDGGAGVCYYFTTSTGTTTWDQARRDCISRQSDLIIINSQEEQDLLKGVSGGQNVWIGLTDRETEGVWKWVDGTPLTTPTFWNWNQPDNYESEHCAALWSFPRGWNDYPCTGRFNWMCERAV